MNGKITPFGMEQVLQEKFAHTSQQYQDFIQESEMDLDESDRQIRELELQLEKERIMSAQLETQKNKN